MMSCGRVAIFKPSIPEATRCGASYTASCRQIIISGPSISKKDENRCTSDGLHKCDIPVMVYTSVIYKRWSTKVWHASGGLHKCGIQVMANTSVINKWWFIQVWHTRDGPHKCDIQVMVCSGFVEHLQFSADFQRIFRLFEQLWKSMMHDCGQ